jgi:Domain of unknown function (DUF1707)
VHDPTSKAVGMADEPAQQGSLRASDADRQATVERLDAALAEGRITAEEFRQRTETAYAATTTAELRPLLADLPALTPRTEIVGTRAPATQFNVLGDIRLGGASVPRRVGTVLGNIRVDLRELRTDDELVELELWTGLGNVDVIIADGVDGELEGWTLLGKRRVELAPVPRVPGTPRVVVRAHSGLGDLRLRSLAPGAPLRRWGRRGV